MADSDIQVTALTASQAGPGAILVAPITSGGSCLPYLALAAVEIWGGSTSSTGSFTLLGDTITGFVHSGLAASTTRYYRARARDASGNYGDWFPSSGSVSATTSTVTPGPNSVGTDELKDGAVTGPKIPNNTIPSAKLISVNADKISVTSLSAISANLGTVNAGYLTADVSYLGAVYASQIQASSLAAISANLGTVTAGSIAAGVAYLGTINANQVTTGTLGAGVVYAGDINADRINAGTFTGRTFRTAADGDRRITIDATSHTFEMRTYNGTAQLGFIGQYPTLHIQASGGGYAANLVGDATVNGGAVMVQCGMFSPGGVGLAVFSRGDGTHAHGFRAYTRLVGETTISSRGGQGIVAVSNTGGGHAFFAEKGGYAPFTGVHDAFVAKDEPTEIGDIVCDLKVVARNGVDDTVTEVYVAEDDADPSAVGVVARRTEFVADATMPAVPGGVHSTFLREILAEKYDRLAINSLGEGQVNVCGRGGDIAAGDLIMTSTLRGKGQRQPDGIVRNYTVAKARENVTFTGPDDWKRVSCIYLAG